MNSGQQQHLSSSSSANGAELTFKILITTDNHLGFLERDAKRGDDSFTTFEEILRAARVEHQVDLMLLGGDLFHDNKPSLGCLNRTCTLFRKYLWGSKPVEFALRSKAADNFPTHAVPIANWQDPNMNIAVPVFAIHGNHDDPVGGTSSLDILANNGHLNYFGTVSSLEDIVVQPVLLQKGSTHIALYGLGNIRDDRLHRCFQLKKVHFVAPKPEPNVRWFNILLVHQNRGMRDSRSKSGITEAMLAGFGMHLVIWGNEHEQRMVPEVTLHRYDIIQPGSSILTSITPLECNPKQYGILEVRGVSYRITSFPLRSVRPVVRRTVELWRDNPRGRTADDVEEFLKTVVEEMIDEAEAQLQNIPDDVLKFHPNIRFPLMRLSVDFTDPESAEFPKPNFVRFGQLYMDVVANPGDTLREIKASDKRSAVSRAAGLRRGQLGKDDVALVNGQRVVEGDGTNSTGDAFHYAAAIPQFRSVDIATKVAEVFRSGVRPPCQLLSEMELSAAVYAFAEKNEKNAIEDKIDEMLHLTQKQVWRRMGESTDILDAQLVTAEVRRCKLERERKFFKELEELTTAGEDCADHEGDKARRHRHHHRQRDGGGSSGLKEVEGGGHGEKGSSGEDTDNDKDDDDKQEAARFARLSQMFDGVSFGLDTGVISTSSRRGATATSALAESLDAEAAELLRRAAASGNKANRGGGLANMPVFLRDHLRIILQEQERDTSKATAGRVLERKGTGGAQKEEEEEQDDDDANQDGNAYEVLLGEDLEDLPDDGLHHIGLDEFVAREVGGDTFHSGVGGGDASRKRARVTSAAVPVYEIDVDDDVDADGQQQAGGVGGGGDRGTRPRAATGTGGDGPQQPTRCRPGRSTAAGGGGGSKLKGETSLAPALNLVSSNNHTNGGERGGAGAGASSARGSRTGRASGAGPPINSVATLQLLSKWGSQQK